MKNTIFLQDVSGDEDYLFEWDRTMGDLQLDKALSDSIDNPIYKNLLSIFVKRFILVDDGRSVGKIWLDYDKGHYVIYYVVYEEYELMGYERKVLELVEKYLTSFHGNVELHGKCNLCDIAKQALFEELKYSIVYKAEYIEYQKRIELNKYFCEEKKQQGGVLLLTNNRNALSLYRWLCQHEEFVNIYCKELAVNTVLKLNPEIVISYNYKHIIGDNVIKSLKNKIIINLHISLLPYNRGAQPNFWSFIDETPKGVTIHRIERGLDKGDIICQKELFFDEEKETFSSSYEKLNVEIVNLLISNWEKIRRGEFEYVKQKGEGTYHSLRSFQEFVKKVPVEWSDVILDYRKRCKDYAINSSRCK